ncbi:MAG: N(4)-(beta-N-acetylglucosaminyl)-L-asparaginase [Deltaproteobacteria bacterium]|nr:N(4)-(beta-N-acetylglucosaminyl)-L-asparaginase [Deltaproteobacteria bacterium]
MTKLILANNQAHNAISGAVQLLSSGRSCLDVVEEGIKHVENDPEIITVGYGGAPNLLGQMELDASIMDGSTRQTGAVGALIGFAHPISVARRVMHDLPHELLVGEGAARFADEIGAEKRDMLSPKAKQSYVKWIAENFEGINAAEELQDKKLAEYTWPSARADIAKGTTTFLVCDGKGMLAAGASTSGWAYCYPGRLGDSPIIGAGVYVDNRYGGATCTHTGEMTIRCSTARSVVLYMKKGATVQEASHEALQDLKDLKLGYIGPVVIHAIDTNSNHYVCTNQSEGAKEPYCFWKEDMAEPVRTSPVVI